MDLHYSDETVCARAGVPGAFATRPSVPALYLTAAFDIAGPAQVDALYEGRETGYIYSRDANPNIDAFAADVAKLEGGEAGAVAASGMGILAAALLASVKAGDHLLAVGQVYGKTTQLLNHLQSAFGVAVTYLPVNKPAEVKAAIRPETRLCLVESISNPTMEVADLPELVAALGGPTGVPLLVDATFSPPPLLRPLSLGAAMVWHSATKYLNGHGDVTAGVLAGPKDRVVKIRQMTSLFGINGNPMESWLAARGMRTLPLRMAKVSATAHELARFLSDRPEVTRVCYPGLESHPTHAVARKLLTHGFGGMLSFELRRGVPAVADLFAALAEIPFSPTLADARTTVSYPMKTSHRTITAEQRKAWGIGDGMVRLSVGLEDVADLRRELGDALAKIDS